MIRLEQVRKRTAVIQKVVLCDPAGVVRLHSKRLHPSDARRKEPSKKATNCTCTEYDTCQFPILPKPTPRLKGKEYAYEKKYSQKYRNWP